MLKLMFTSCLALAVTIPMYAQIGLGTTSPDASSVVDISSTDKGMLTPRLTNTQREAIHSPATGLLIYNLTENCLQVNSGTPLIPEWICVGKDTSLPVVIEDCNANGFEGVYLNGATLTFAHKFSVTITNQSFNTADIAFGTNDLVLSGVTGITVNSVNPTSVTLTSGASQVVEYELTGTPNSLGVLKGEWNKLGLSCTKEVNISKGNATFSLPHTSYVFSAEDGALGVDNQGIIDNVNNQLKVYIPYSDAVGSYDAYEGDFVYNAPQNGEGGDVDGFRLTYPAGSFPSPTGYITATVEIENNGSFNAKKQVLGVENSIAVLNVKLNGYQKGVVNINVTGGIKDRNFNDPNYKYIYFPVATLDGNVWLNTDLGQNYSNINSVSFFPDLISNDIVNFQTVHSPISTKLYQWGRGSDGHENRTSSTTTILASTATPSHDDFILTTAASDNNWLSPSNDNLWQGESGVNNPCPLGYRIPTKAEFLNVIDKEGMTTFGTGISSTSFSFLTAAGVRFSSDGSISPNNYSGFWTSDIPHSAIRILVGTVSTFAFPGGSGLQIRCIKAN